MGSEEYQPCVVLVVADPDNKSDEFHLRLRPNPRPIGKRWFEAVKLFVERGTHIIEDPYRFYGFPTPLSRKEFVVSELNRNFDILNEYQPDSVRHRAHMEMDQDYLNVLHTYFEVLSGTCTNAAEFYLNAPDEIRHSLSQCNALIHRYESQFLLSKGVVLQRLNLNFYPTERWPLQPEDYSQFRLHYNPGEVFLTYVDVGKPIWDLYTDQDQVIGEDAILPQRHYSSGFSVRFSQRKEPSQEVWNDFWKWYENYRPLMESRGISKEELSLGFCPVGTVEKFSETTIDEIAKRQFMKGVYIE